MKSTIENLIDALQKSWQCNTSYCPSEWSVINPARGQCIVSSLVVQNYLGGDLLRYKVSGPNIDETHYCNILPNGTVLDTTASQYNGPVTLAITPIDLEGYSSARDKRLADDETRARYELLLHAVAKFVS